MTLTPTQFGNLTNQTRHTGWRYKILKTAASGGAAVPAPGTGYETLKASSAGGTGYDYAVGTGSFKQVIRDVLHHRNRTIILHDVGIMTADPGAVISIINHVDDTITAINSTTSAGWPTTYTQEPKEMIFDAETNYLYVSIQGEGTPGVVGTPPAVLKINLNDVGDELLSCSGMTDNSDFLDCVVFEMNGSTISEAKSLTKNVGYYHLLGIKGAKVYTFFEIEGASTGFPGTDDWLSPHFGHFDKTSGNYTFCWANKRGTTALVPGPSTDPRVGGVVDGFGYYPDRDNLDYTVGFAPGYHKLNSWDLDVTTGILTMAWSPNVIHDHGGNPVAAEWGWEASIIDLDVDEAIDHSLKTGTFREKYIQIITSKNWDCVPGDPTLYNWSFSGDTFTPTTIDCAAFSTGLIEIIYTWKFIINGTEQDLLSIIAPSVYMAPGIHVETGAAGLEFVASGSGTIESIGGFTPDGKNYYTNTKRESIVIALDNKNPYVTIILAARNAQQIWYTPSTCPQFIEVDFEISIREFPYGLKHSVGVMSAVPLRQAADDLIPCIIPSPMLSGAAPINVSSKTGTTSGSVYTESLHTIKIGDTYFAAIWDYYSAGHGLWLVRDDGAAITRLTAATSDLVGDKVRALAHAGGGSALVASETSIQLFDAVTQSFTWGAGTIEFTPASASYPILGLAFDGDWITCWNSQEIWWFTPGGTRASGGPDVDGAPWRRSPRVWWDGENPDVIVGAGGNVALDTRGRTAGFISDGLTHSKGEASYELTFTAPDVDYLPWVDSTFNENPGAPGSYAGTLEHGNRIILERGIRATDGTWEWLPECQTFIVSEPGDVTGGIASLAVTAKGIIGTLLTRSVYEFTHRPTEAIIAAGALTAVAGSGGKTWQYEIGGNAVHDWASSPQPTVTVGGAPANGCTIAGAPGTVTFPADMTATPPSASFTYYVPGTNEAEDIILCILQHPNEIGGAGLDTSWFTRSIVGETLTTTDDLTYAFSKNMVIAGHSDDVIYVDGVPTGSGFTWNVRAGTVTFGVAQTGKIITGDCRYYTIQKSGKTLREITFTPQKQANSYDAINEVVRRVDPNYIFHEDTDGKLICDYYTQKAAGSEDLIITDTDVVLIRASENPMYFDLATYVISYGQAPLSELPNLALGKTVADLWAFPWHAGTDVQVITDGDPATQATAGYGAWGSDGSTDPDEMTKHVQFDLIATGDDGLPLISIDLEAPYKIETIILARGSQVATEGDGGAVCEYSVWISSNGSTWKRIVNRFNLPPGQNVQFKAGTNYDVGTAFQYIRVNLHSLGLYKWKGGKTDSQFGLSEVQCYESEIIKGIAKLQDTDPSASFYDTYGLLSRYSEHLVHVARNGQPDAALYTQARVQADAEDTLNEMMRLLSQVEMSAAYFPGVKLFDTVKIVNGAMQRTVTMFVENKSISTGGGDTFTGANLP